MKFVKYLSTFIKEIGTRDLSTLEFCKQLRMESYISHCLTLTLPKREIVQIKIKYFCKCARFLAKIYPKILDKMHKSLIKEAFLAKMITNGKNYYDMTKNLL